jgi:hypothetical protein
VGSEYFINSQALQDKVRDLLPSQGGAGAGFDLSASTQIIPIIDLTESAEGSDVRQDLQTSLSFGTITSFNVSNTTTTIINNTGYYRVFGISNVNRAGAAGTEVRFTLSDGVSDKIFYKAEVDDESGTEFQCIPFDFNVFLAAGDLLKVFVATSQANCIGATRQIADITGTLVNP